MSNVISAMPVLIIVLYTPFKIKSKIYMKSYTEENEKYCHPYATANDIAGQKDGSQSKG